jgi:hypothetical protein
MFNLQTPFYSAHNDVGHSAISVMPETDQYLAISSTLNVTFTCNVSEDELNSVGRRAVWEVESRMIDNATRSLFESVGIFLETRSPGVADLIVTGVAGEQYNESMVMVRCLAETAAVPPSVEIGPTLFVRFFGK